MSDDQVNGQQVPASPANVAPDPIKQILQFFRSVPVVSKEVALKIAEQLPEIRKIAMKALGGLERAHKETVEGNSKSQDRVHDAYQDIRDILRGELQENDLSWDQKKEIYDMLNDTAEKQGVKDTENKKALDTWLKTAGVVAIAALAVAVALLGASEENKEA